MSIKLSRILVLSGSALLCFGATSSDRWSMREQETIHRTLSVAGSPVRVVVDNVQGYVHVRGGGGSQVELTANKSIRAETANDLAEAKTEVKLDVSEKAGTVSVTYNAPWRCRDRNGGCGGEHHRFYDVTFDIDVQIPREARVVISTVNKGDVTVEGVSGDFEVSNVNGGISMAAISGSGEAHTVNGPVAVHFEKNPSGPTSFKTVNGPLDIYMRPELAADLLFKTLNGEIYTDFDVMPRSEAAATPEQRNGMFVYRSNRNRAGRVGRGGPELKFNTVNGSIRLHREG